MIPNSIFDPRTKLVIVMNLSTLGILVNDVIILLGIFIISSFVALILNVQLWNVYKKLKRVINVVLVLVVVQSIFTHGGDPLVSIGSFTVITDLGLEKAGEFILRIGIIITSASILSTSSYREIVQGLVQWKMPYEIAFMVSVAIRFLPIFTQEFKDAMVSLQLRGVEFEAIPLKKKIKVYSYLFFPIVSNAIFKARELSVAMETRAFRAYSTRTSYLVLKMQSIDYMIIFISFFITLSSILIYYTNI